MNKQKLGLSRNTIDKYYTNPLIAKQCVDMIKNNINIAEDDLIIEPSAGNGSFINDIKTISSNHIFYDLEPENTEIVKQDYLTFNYCGVKRVHVIGNPPFGRQSSLAIKFIKKSTSYCHSLSFILPKSFKKDSMKKCFPLNYHLIFEFDIPDNSFVVDGKEHDVPCVFQIWEKRDELREVMKKLIPKGYNFVKQNEEPDISFRRVGVNAGNVYRECATKSVQSHYFIRFDNELTDELYEQLSTIDYSCKNNTVGPRSISKQELIKEFNVIL